MIKVCEQMQQLRKMLDEKGIPWQDVSDDWSRDDFEMWIVRTHFEYKGFRWSAANGFGVYGGWGGANPNNNENMGLLELYNFNDEPCGWLTAEEVMERIGANED